MKLWKRNAVVAAILLLVCGAVYLNWSYNKQDKEDAARTLGDALPLEASGEEEGLLAETGGDAAGEPGSEEVPVTGYFDAARLNRRQARDSALELLQEAAAGEDADQTIRNEANAAIQAMASLTVSEAQIENLITAKGYADCVAFIGDSSVSVVVAQLENGLTDADVARITEIVSEETGMSASQIKIIEAMQ